jgi:hypothetical protein
MHPRDDFALPASAAAMLTPWTQPTTAPTRPVGGHRFDIRTARRTGHARA